MATKDDGITNGEHQSGSAPVTDERATRGLSRRRVLIGGAIGGAAVWATPVIDSVLSSAAAVSTPCPPPDPYTLSGLTILYYRGGTLYWTFIGKPNTSACNSTGSISDDNSFTATCGPATLGVNTPVKGTVTVTVSSVSTTPIDDSVCYFVATSRGANLTPAGVTAGVQVLAWIAHDGSFKSDPEHFKVKCGSNCVTF